MATIGGATMGEQVDAGATDTLAGTRDDARCSGRDSQVGLLVEHMSRGRIDVEPYPVTGL